MYARIAAVLTLAVLSIPASAEPKKKATRPDYPFTVPPARAFDALGRLEKVAGRSFAPSKDERSLFEDAVDGKLDTWSFGEACLIASGVTDPLKRKEYMKKLDALEEGAIAALKDAKTPYEKGKRLLEFIHAGPMANGYVSGQTNLHTIFDEGHFNCVSATVLYNVLGRRLGLDLWAIEVPEHVYACLHVGNERADVETTNKLGFNPSRDPKERNKILPEGKTYMPEKHAKDKREVGELILASIICSNQSVELGKQDKHAEALIACFRTLCLDPGNTQASKNVVAHLTNWGNKLSDEGKFEDALAVIEVGMQLAPKESGLSHNYKVTWHRFAESAMKAGNEDAALTVVRRAAKAVPGDEFTRAEADLFLREGEQLVRTKDWNKALTTAGRGLEKVNAKAQVAVKRWRNGVYLRWSQEHLDRGEYDEALKILKQGMAADPKDTSFRNNTLATYDTWAHKFIDAKDWARAIEIYRKGLQDLPGDGHLQQNLKYCEQEAKK